MANPTGAPTPHGIPNFAPGDRPRLASSPGLPDILAVLDSLIGIYRIATPVVLPAPASAIDFSLIPQNYSVLELIVAARDDTAGVATDGYVNVRVNADAGPNYNSQALYAAGAGATGTRSLGDSSVRLPGCVNGGAAAGLFGSGFMRIIDYANATRHKLLHTDGGFDNLKQLVVGRWLNAAAINRLTLTPAAGGNFAAGTIAILHARP
jgi:hypothetical protein